MCLPTWFSPESGTVEGTSAELMAPPPPPPHVKYIPHGRGVDHRLICPVGGWGYVLLVFLCPQPLYDPATTGKEVGIVYWAVNCDRLNVLLLVMTQRKAQPMGWSWTSISSCALFLWPCWLVRLGGCITLCWRKIKKVEKWMLIIAQKMNDGPGIVADVIM